MSAQDHSQLDGTSLFVVTRSNIIRRIKILNASHRKCDDWRNSISSASGEVLRLTIRSEVKCSAIRGFVSSRPQQQHRRQIQFLWVCHVWGTHDSFSNPVVFYSPWFRRIAHILHYSMSSVSPSQNNIALSIVQDLLYVQCLLTMSAGFIDPGV